VKKNKLVNMRRETEGERKREGENERKRG